MSVDHLYEKAIIERFLKNSIVPKSDSDCDDMITVSFSCANANRMQDLLDQLPGMNFVPVPRRNTKEGFAIIDRELDSLKGQMFDEQLGPTSVKIFANPSYHFA